jgi:hypothetical protein
MQLRGPREQLGGACWLPRFIDKTRKFLAGELPLDYAEGFGNPHAMDGVFLKFFALNKDRLLEAVRNSAGDDERVTAWFRAQPEVTSDKIIAWNDLAPRIGAPGERGYEIFSKLVRERYPDAPYTGVESVFEVIEADEGF